MLGGGAMEQDTTPMLAPHRVVALMAAAAAVGVLVFDRVVRRVEAETSAAVVAVVGLDAGSIGTSVVFLLDGRPVGYALTAGCSVAFILAPLYAVVAGLSLTTRLTAGRGLATLVVLTALLFSVNQARFAVIGWAMRHWGFERGYERSHVFLGTMVSTIGVVAGLLIVVMMMSRSRTEMRHA